MRKTPLVWSYLILSAALAVLVAVMVAADDAWWSTLTPNLVAELVGILAVVGLIDAAVKRRERAELQRREKQALRQLKFPLVRHFHLLMQMYKAALDEVPTRTFTGTEIFEGDFAEVLRWFDFDTPAPVIPQRDWFTYLASEFGAFKEALRRTIDSYGIFLDPDVIDFMEEVINSHVMGFVLQAPVIKQVDQGERFIRAYNLLWDKTMAPLLHEYTSAVSRLIERFNNHVDPGDQITFPPDPWSDNVTPAVGSARIDLEKVARKVQEQRKND